MTEWIPRFSVQRPVTVVTAFMVILVVGMVALNKIPVQMMPSGWNIPMLWVWAPWRDSTPLEAEARVVRPLEQQLATVPGIKHVDSTASSDNSSIQLEFYGSTSMDVAYNDVMDRLERAASELPTDIRQTYLWRFNPDDEPVIWAGVSIPEGAPDAWLTLDRNLRRKLQRIPGVGRVEIWGISEPSIWVDFRRDALTAHRVDLATLVARLSTDNFQIASGRVEDQGAIRIVRGLSRFEDLAELRRYPVQEGVVLNDVADISYMAAARADINRIAGQEGAAFTVNKESTANTVQICEELRQALADLEQDPKLKGYQFPVFFDQGKLVEEALWNLEESAIEGGILAVLVLILFLREWRITLLITATIPASLLLTIILLYFQGRTLNLLSMLGLMLAVGMVVDNAVVVVETIYRRRQGGEDPVKAAISGTAEVLLPITLSTLTSIVVFLPVILMSGDTTSALFLSEIGMPVVYIQVGSLLITLLFTPLSTVWLGAQTVHADPAWVVWLGAKVDAWVARILRYPMDSLMGIIGVLVLTLVVPVQAVDCGGGTSSAMSDFSVRFEVPSSFTYSERLATVTAIEKTITDHQERWGVRVYFSRLRSGDRSGRINVYLNENQGQIPKEAIIDEARASLPDLPGVKASIGKSDSSQRDQNNVRIDVYGDSTAVLATLAEEMERRMRSVEGVITVYTGAVTRGSDEVRLVVDRTRAATMGLTATSVGQTVSFAMRGLPLPSWYNADREVSVVSRFRLEDRSSVKEVLDLSMLSPVSRGWVPLSGVVSASVGKGWGTIVRRDGQTSLGVTAEFSDKISPEAAYARVEGALEGMAFPVGYGRARGSEWKELLEDQQSQQLAMLLSIVFVFLIMGVLFESFLVPMAVITTVPMALFGVWWGLYLSHTAFDAMAGVGTIILIGIVVNNGIVLVDVIEELRREGMPRDEALRRAVGLRLRPILMTALSAVVGVIPMALGTATFVGIPYAPMGRVVASGMIVATFLTLFFVPYLYAQLDDMRASGGRWLAYIWPRSR